MLLSMFVNLNENLKEAEKQRLNIFINSDSWKNAENFLKSLPTYYYNNLESYINQNGEISFEILDYENINKKIKLTFIDDQIILLNNSATELSIQNFYNNEHTKIINYLKNNINVY